MIEGSKVLDESNCDDDVLMMTLIINFIYYFL